MNISQVNDQPLELPFIQNLSIEQIKSISKMLQEATCPIQVRKLIEATHAHMQLTGQPIRSKTCVAALVVLFLLFLKELRAPLCGLVVFLVPYFLLAEEKNVTNLTVKLKKYVRVCLKSGWMCIPL